MSKQYSDTRPALVATNGTIYRRLASGVYSPVEMTILGEPASKSNSRSSSKNRRTGKTFSRKSDKALAYVGSFLAQVPPEVRQLKLGGPNAFLRANVSVWYANWRSDVDVELIYDCLQLAGVVSNDRWIREKFVYGAHIDKDNPRVEIRLEEI